MIQPFWLAKDEPSDESIVSLYFTVGPIKNMAASNVGDVLFQRGQVIQTNIARFIAQIY